MSKRTVFKTYEFALVVVRNFDGKWLAVNESQNRGWWIPAGGVDKNETFIDAAHRETKEEAGIEISLKGVLKVEHSVF
jgi:8-oxo-dGTP pyrophosphatase MutT (NUDIX family)